MAVPLATQLSVNIPYAMPLSSLVCAIVLLLWLGPVALAHVHIVSHEPRYGMDTIKSPPCGLSATSSARGEVVHTFLPGETITLEYDEYIAHPGHFRISFDLDGEDDFVEPAGYDDLYTNATVLLDGIAAHAQAGSGGIRSVYVTLPDVECDNCTLQLAQIMTDKPPYEPATNDLYYNCLDVELVPEPRRTVTAAAALASLLVLSGLRGRLALLRGREALP
jgi:hypothetical protein